MHRTTLEQNDLKFQNLYLFYGIYRLKAIVECWGIFFLFLIVIVFLIETEKKLMNLLD